MKLQVNGNERCFDDGEPADLLELLDHLEVKAEKGVAIAVNDAVIPRSRWGQHHLEENDRIEIIRATQGG